MDLTLIIVNWNSAQLLDNCLSSVEKYVSDVSFEAIVIDNHSSDEDIQILKERIQPKYPWVSIIYNIENVGFAKANNQGLEVARGEYVLLLNPDTCFIESGLFNLFTHLKLKNVGMVGCKLLNDDKTNQLSCFYFPRLWRILGISLLIHKFLPLRYRQLFSYSAEDHEITQHPDWILGAFMLLPKDVMQQIGGFDELIFMYGEDMDLCFRLRKLELDIVYAPEMAIIHYGGCSGRQAWTNARKEAMVYTAILKFYAAHFGSFKLLLARIIYSLGAIIRMFTHSLTALFPSKRKRALNELKTQWLVLITQFKPL